MDDNVQPTPAVTDTSDSRATILMNLEGLIKNHISSISRLQEETKKQKGMLDDVFNNNPTYKQHAEQAKEAARIKSQTKQEIMKQPAVADLANKVKSLQSELKELQGALSDYLQQFAQMSGMNEIEDDSGEVRQIVYIARLGGKANFKQ